MRKGKRVCSQHLLSIVVTYEHLLYTYCTFVTAITPMIVSSLFVETLAHMGWKATIEEEMHTLKMNGT